MLDWFILINHYYCWYFTIIIIILSWLHFTCCQDYEEDLFERALPCLTAIGSALPPDYSMSYHDESYVRESCFDADGIYQPKPVETAQ